MSESTQWRPYLNLIRFNNPIGSILLLWPTLWALWIAGEGRPDRIIVLIFVFGVFLMRSAGCAINDVIDHKLDRHVARTRTRPVAAGNISPLHAVLFAAILCFIAFLLVLCTNKLTVLLAIAGLLLTLLYPFMKRVIPIPQAILGMAFSWGIPMAFAAQTGAVPAVAWLLFAVACLWPLAYDTLYAMADRTDDLTIGIHSSAIWFGSNDRLMVAVLLSCFLAGLMLVGFLLKMQWPYFIAILSCIPFVFYQHALVSAPTPEHCLQAFTNHRWVGALIFAGIVLNYL